MKTLRTSLLGLVMVAGVLAIVNTADAQYNEYEFERKWGRSFSGGWPDYKLDFPHGVVVNTAGHVIHNENGGNQETQTWLLQPYPNLNQSALHIFGSSTNGNVVHASGLALSLDETIIYNLGMYPNDSWTGVHLIDNVESSATFGARIDHWGVVGGLNGQFRNPRGVAVDSSGNLWIADTYNHRIQKLDSSGNHLFNVFRGGPSTWDGPGNHNLNSGADDGWFRNPRGVAVDADDNLWVADTDNHRVQMFTSDGHWFLSFGTSGTGDGEFDSPCALAFDEHGNLLVLEGGEPSGTGDRIQIFDENGNFLSTLGSAGSGDGQFKGASGIAVDSQGSVYVADTFQARIQKFRAVGVLQPPCRSCCPCVDCGDLVDDIITTVCEGFGVTAPPASTDQFEAAVLAVSQLFLKNVEICAGSAAPKESCLELVLSQLPQ